MSNTLASYWRFLLAGLTKHAQTGAIVPSQRVLIQRMIVPVPPTYRGLVVELGPGTGALTLRLARRCSSARILACEINPVLAQDLNRRLAAAGLRDRVEVISDSAQRLLEEMAGKPETRAGYVISGIPLGNLDREQATALIDRIAGALAKGGMYIQFQHSLLDRKKIQARFARLRTVPVWLNFPPAVIYYAQQPIPRPGQPHPRRVPARRPPVSEAANARVDPLGHRVANLMLQIGRQILQMPGTRAINLTERSFEPKVAKKSP